MLRIETIDQVRQFTMARSLGGKAAYFTSAYLVDGLLIDSGCPQTRREFMAAVSDMQISGLVNTHSHEDHIGANADLYDQKGLIARIHPAGLPVLADPRKNQPLRLYQRVMWGRPRAAPAQPLEERVETERHSFQVIHTPGHSPDHVCFYEPEQGRLFTGDAFVGGRDRALRADYNIRLILDSLKKLAGLEVEVMFPASGKVRKKPTAELLKKVEYLEECGQRIEELRDRGLDIDEIRREVFGREPAINYITFGHFSAKNLVRSFLEDRA